MAKAKEVAEVEATNAKAAKDNADAESTQIENAAAKAGITELLEFVNGGG